MALVNPERLRRILTKMLDENEFLSPYGIRSLSKFHQQHPYVLHLQGQEYRVDYLPAESNSGMFGGNSNWRGPVWFPVNYLVISVLERYHRFYGSELTVEYPTGSGTKLTLDLVARDLQDRLISLFTRGPDGQRPCFGGTGVLQQDPAWRDNLVFNEYFHGDNGAGLGASNQTGWTGVIADIIRRRYGEVASIGDAAEMSGS
jgi:hypothetical protein